MKNKLIIISGICICITTIGFSLLPVLFDFPMTKMNNEIVTISGKQKIIWENMEKSKTWYHKSVVARDHIEILKQLSTNKNTIKTYQKEALMDLKKAANAAVAAVEVYNNRNFVLSEIEKRWKNINNPNDYWPILGDNLLQAGEGINVLESKVSDLKVNLNEKTRNRNILWIILIVIQGIGLLLGGIATIIEINKSKKC